MTKTFISALIVCALLDACTNTSIPTTPTQPGSALGDAPTLTGSVANLAEGDLAGKTLELYAGTDRDADGELAPTEALVRATVAADGTFSLELPGEDVMTPHLVPGGNLDFAPPACNVTSTPSTYRVATLDVALYADGEPVGGNLVYANDPQTNEAYLRYVDQNVTQKGGCTSGELSGLKVVMELRKGWNTVVFSAPELAYRTQALDASYRWFIPFCTVGCPESSGSE